MTAMHSPRCSAAAPDLGARRVPPGFRGADTALPAGAGLSVFQGCPIGTRFVVGDYSETFRRGKVGLVRRLRRSVVGLMLWFSTTGCAGVPERTVRETSLTTFVDSSPATSLRTDHPPCSGSPDDILSTRRVAW